MFIVDLYGEDNLRLKVNLLIYYLKNWNLSHWSRLRCHYRNVNLITPVLVQV